MSDAIIYKCGACTDPIVVDRDHTSNVVFYKKKHYHLKCFCAIATKRSQSKSTYAPGWKEALDNILMLEADTKKKLEDRIARDNLNSWLLNNYDITETSRRFWEYVADLNKGVYKGKRCRPVNTETLFEAWKWGQKKLDSIARNNKMNNTGPADDNARIIYDLAILIGKIPSYLAYKEKQKAAEIERERELKENVRIDYSKITNSTQRKDNNNFQDISSLVDDLF